MQKLKPFLAPDLTQEFFELALKIGARPLHWKTPRFVQQRRHVRHDWRRNGVLLRRMPPEPVARTVVPSQIHAFTLAAPEREVAGP
jgi:hypothetical protein